MLLGAHEIMKPGNRWEKDGLPVDPTHTLTYEYQSSLIDLLAKDYKSTPHPTLEVSYDDVVAERATHFVSFAYGCDFYEVVAGLERFFVDNQDIDPNTTFFWTWSSTTSGVPWTETSTGGPRHSGPP